MCQKTIRGTFFPSMRSATNRGMGWDMIPVTWNRLVLKLTSNATTEIYIFLKIEFYLKPILKNLGIYLLKFVTVVWTLNCNVPWIYKKKTSNKNKLLSLSNLSLLFYQFLTFFREKCTFPHFPAMINQN